MDPERLTDCIHCGMPEWAADGFGYTASMLPVCYACCALRDMGEMLEHGTATLYLTGHRGHFEVTNWPGSLAFPVHHWTPSKRGGGFGSPRVDAWFIGPDGREWHAINRGDMSIARCRVLKRQPHYIPAHLQ